jgi:adenylate cyclase
MKFLQFIIILFKIADTALCFYLHCPAGAQISGPLCGYGRSGCSSRLEYTVIGEAVNLSAKLEKHTKKEGVRALCTAKAYQEAIAQNYQPPAQGQKLTRRTVEGVTEPLDLMIIGT